MNTNQNYDQYDPAIKATFNQLRAKWETLKETFPLTDHGKWIVLTSDGQALVFPEAHEASSYRIDHPNLITIQRCIGGEPVVIGPIEDLRQQQ
jgi:hypothetical protein